MSLSLRLCRKTPGALTVDETIVEEGGEETLLYDKGGILGAAQIGMDFEIDSNRFYQKDRILKDLLIPVSNTIVETDALVKVLRGGTVYADGIEIIAEAIFSFNGFGAKIIRAYSPETRFWISGDISQTGGGAHLLAKFMRIESDTLKAISILNLASSVITQFETADAIDFTSDVEFKITIESESGDKITAEWGKIRRRREYVQRLEYVTVDGEPVTVDGEPIYIFLLELKFMAELSEFFATANEVLTGTEGEKLVTPAALAALWEKGSNIASSGTISIGEGGIFHVTGTTTITISIPPRTKPDGCSFWYLTAR